MSRLARRFDSFILCPLKLYSQADSWMNWSRSTASFPVIILYVSMRSPLTLRSSKEVSTKRALICHRKASDKVYEPFLWLPSAPFRNNLYLSSSEVTMPGNNIPYEVGYTFLPKRDVYVLRSGLCCRNSLCRLSV